MKTQECYFLPIGGVQEIGMNFNLFGFIKDDVEQWIIVDAGVSVTKTLGISLKMASIDSILNKNIIGIICTHAHEDHIGAIPWIINRFPKKIPIYATKFTMCMIQEKLIERNVDADLREVAIDSKFSVGEFSLEFVYVTHSIPEPNMIIIKFGGLTLLHTGDWKLDHDPVLGPITDEKRIANLGQQGVDFLICDSTNSMVTEPTGSEGMVRDSLNLLIPQFKGKRILLSCFSSNVARIKTLVEIAKKHNRKIAFVGRSFQRITNIAYKTRYLVEDDHIIPAEDINKYKPGEVLILCTGSQGEPKSVLHRVVYDLHNNIKINPNDVVIFSARVIPGNDNEIAMIKNNLMGRGVTVVDAYDEYGIHVSGHPSQPELRRIMELTKPKWIIPVHGDRMHLVGLENFARSLGYRNILIPHNGSLIQLNGKQPEIVFTVQCGIDGLDGKTIVNLESQFLSTRMRIGENGCMLISVFSENNVDISSCGILPSKIINSPYYNNTIQKIIQQNLTDNEERTIKHTASLVGTFIYENYGKNPIIIIHKSQQ